MSWFAVGAAVASAVVSQYSAAKTAKKQNKATIASMAEQAKLQREANRNVNQNLDKLETSTDNDEFAGRESSIRDQLRRNQSMALAGIQNTGGGDAVTEYAGAAKPQAVGYGDDINRWLSGIDAPALQRQGEAFDRADVDSQLGLLRRNSAQEDAMLRMKLAGIRPSPWLSMLSQGLSAYSGAKGFGGGSMAGGGQGLTNLGGMTPQTFYSNAPGSLPGMQAPLVGNPFGIGSIFGNGKIGS